MRLAVNQDNSYTNMTSCSRGGNLKFNTFHLNEKKEHSKYFLEQISAYYCIRMCRLSVWAQH